MDSAKQQPRIVDRIGERWGQYKIISSLEHGSFSRAYLGESLQDRTKQCVIDIFPTSLTEAQVESFLQQTRRLIQLVHPNILHMLDSGAEHFVPFVALEYITHIPLRQLYRKGEPQEIGKLLPYLKQVAAGLQYAHDQGVVHKSVRPKNVLLNRENRAMLYSFAIDTLSKDERYQNYQRQQDPIDVIAYSAPEQIQHQSVKASDQYGLGVMVYEWLSGALPFQGTYYEIAYQRLHGSPAPLRSLVPTLSKDVEQVVMTAMAQDPARRFQSISAFMYALEQACGPQAAGSIQVAPAIPLAQPPVASAKPQATGRPTPPAPVLAEPGPSAPHLMPSRPIPAPVLQPQPVRPSAPPVAAVALPAQGAWGTPPIATPAPAPAKRPATATRRAFFVSAAGLALVAGGGSWLLWHRLHPSAPLLPTQDTTNPPVLDAGTTATASGPVLVYSAHKARVNGVAWSPDGKSVASVSDDKQVLICDSTTGKTLQTYTGHSAAVNAVAWSPDGMLIASASDDKTVQVWSPTTGKRTFTYTGHSAAVNAVDWSSDSRIIASGGDDHTLQAWFPKETDVLLIYRQHNNAVTSVAWSPDMSLIASGSWDTSVQVCATVNSDAFAIGDTVFTYRGHAAEVNAIAWSPDGKRLASAGGDNVIQVCNGVDGSSVHFPPRRHDKTIRSVAWSPDGHFLASASDDKTARVWTADTGETTFTFTQHTDAVFTVAWSPDSKSVASGAADKTVRIWQPRNA